MTCGRLNTILALALLPLAFAMCRSESAYIRGNLANLPDGNVRLMVWDGSFTAVDSARSKDGEFAIQTPAVLPDILFLQFESVPDFYLPVVVDGSDVSVSGNFRYSDDITVSGSRPNELYYNYRREVNNYYVLIAAINKELDTYADSTAIADSTFYLNFYHKRDSLWRLVEGSKNLFVEAHPSCIVSAMFAAETLSDSTSLHQVDSLLGKLDPSMSGNAFLDRLRRRRWELSDTTIYFDVPN